MPVANMNGSTSRRWLSRVREPSWRKRHNTCCRFAEIAPGEPVSLEFVNVDVRDVVRAVLGDTLKVSYMVDPAVQGALTLQTSTPLPRSAVLPALDNALHLSGAAMVQADGIINVVPIASAARVAQMGAAGPTGFIARMVTPRFVAAADLQRVLEPMLPSGSTLRVDTVRNLLIVTGPAHDVATILDNIAIFDVDYLKGMSFALLPLRNGQAKAIAREVTGLLATAGSAISGMVRVTAIDRLNAVLVTAMQPTYIDRVRAGWTSSIWVPPTAPSSGCSFIGFRMAAPRIWLVCCARRWASMRLRVGQVPCQQGPRPAERRGRTHRTPESRFPRGSHWPLSP